MDRRRFTFWIGFGLFTLAEKLQAQGLDHLAAATMGRSERIRSAKKGVGGEHWTLAGDDQWRWFQRENYIKGRWALTGTTTPIHKETGLPKSENIGFLDDSLIPPEMRLSESSDVISVVNHSVVDLDPQLPLAKFRERHGRPPSKWLRSLDADEIRIWLKTIEVPEAGVSGMTYWEHLTRDHSFNPDKIEGLTKKEQAKLHAAAHYGY